MVDILPGPRRLRGRAVGAIVDQFVVAGTSFVLMLIVRRTLGRGALGEYFLLISAMILLTAIETAWVGDSLTVLDRFAARVRSGLVTSQLIFIVACFVAATAMATVNEGWSSGALVFGCMVAFWVCEETARRLFMVRLQFWQLVINDCVYACGAFVGLAALHQAMGHLSVTIVVAAMAIGAAVSIAAAALQLPRTEYRLTRLSLGAFNEVGRFGIWRSAQMAIRPAALLLVQTLVVRFTTKAELGDLGTARLFSQPAMTYVAGVASLLLPLYASDEQRRGGHRERRTLPLPLTTALLVAPVAIYAVVLLSLSHRIAPVVLGPRATISGVAVLGWLMVALMFAAGQPVANVLIAQKRSRELFWVRAADSAIGLAIAIPLIRNVSPNLAPWSLAAGMLIGTIWLAWLVWRSPPTVMPKLSDGQPLAKAIG